MSFIIIYFSDHSVYFITVSILWMIVSYALWMLVLSLRPPDNDRLSPFTQARSLHSLSLISLLHMSLYTLIYSLTTTLELLQQRRTIRLLVQSEIWSLCSYHLHWQSASQITSLISPSLKKTLLLILTQSDHIDPTELFTLRHLICKLTSDWYSGRFCTCLNSRF